MNTDLDTGAFNRMAAQAVVPFVEQYAAAVIMGDISWLESNVPGNKSLTADNRRWLANLEIAEHNVALSVHAVSNKNHRLLGFLLREGAVAAMALPEALAQRDSAAVEMLCHAGPVTGQSYQGVPLLNIAALQNDADSCRHLLDAKADINAWRGDSRQNTALFDCLGHYEQIVRAAFEAGKSDEEITRVPQQDALRTIGLLLERGADEHQKDPSQQGSMSAYEMAEMFSAVDPRPLELIHEWRSGASARAEMTSFMQRLRTGGATPA